MLSERARIEAKIADLKTGTESEDGKKEFIRKVQTVYDVIKNDDVDYETKGVFMRSIFEEIIYDRESDVMTFRLYSVKQP